MKKLLIPALALALGTAPVMAQVERASAPVAEGSSDLKGAPGLTVLIGAVAVAVTVLLLVDDEDDEAVSG
ncbi:MAG: hypothetical protein AAFQ90_01255 [Pseudomonadota bacterium]